MVEISGDALGGPILGLHFSNELLVVPKYGDKTVRYYHIILCSNVLDNH